MLVVMKKGCSREEVDRVVRVVEELGFTPHVLPGAERTAVGVTGNPGPLDPTLFASLPGVAEALPVTRPYKRASRDFHAADTAFSVGGCDVGGGAFTICAGPCAVEGEELLLSVARLVRASGADLLRGGAFKPRTSPYAFRGLELEGLKLLARAREVTGLPVITEALDETSFPLVEEYADVVQIGARNMQNFSLLRRAGRSTRPIFLKRGLSATVEDLLLSAEHVLHEGNPRVILCERGIRTFSTHSRFTLDLGIVPAVHELSHLPIFVDPSHATGLRRRVAPMARAALAAGADGVMLEVHPAPDKARSDGAQALLPEEFAVLAGELRAMRALRAESAPAASPTEATR